MTHEIKIIPCYYDAVTLKEKTFEIRYNNDRGFQKGDIVHLIPVTDLGIRIHSKPPIVVQITYVTNFKQQDGYIVFSFKLI